MIRRFERTGSIEDIDHAIEVLEQAVILTMDHPHHAVALGHLGNAFLGRFERMGVERDLDRAIETLKQAEKLTPTDNPIDHGLWSGSLGNAFFTRFETGGVISDIDQAIEKMEESLRLIPMNHRHHALTLSNLGAALLRRFEARGLIGDIDHAIETIERAAKLMPVRHPALASVLRNLGATLHSRFERTGSLEDLEKAMKALERAVALTPADHPDRAAGLNNLGNALWSRFQNTGSLEDLDRAIKAKEQAVDSTPINHPTHALNKNSLGATLYDRFDRTGSMDDLDSAIELMQQSVTSRHTSHFSLYARWVKNLGAALLGRFLRTGSMVDINMAIKTLQLAVDLTPADNIDHSAALNNLGSALVCRSEKTGSRDGIDCAIATIEQSLNMTPTDHTDYPARLSSLAGSFQSRFDMTGSMEDLDSAIGLEENAVRLTPADHHFRANELYKLGRGLKRRFETTEAIEDRDRAIEILEQGFNCDTASSLDRLKAAQVCADLLINARMLKQATRILEAAVHLLPKLSPRELKRTDSQFNIAQFTSITTRAVSLCLENKDDPYKCLQLLELGRGILANLQLEVRSDISELADQHPELAQRFQTLRDEIESSSSPVEPLLQGDASHSYSDVMNVGRRRKQLFKDFDALLDHVRTLTGFENFLKGPSQTELRSLAEEGPIAVFNVSDIRSDVFLITATDEIRSIHLPHLTPELLEALTNKEIRNVKSRQRNRAAERDKKSISNMKRFANEVREEYSIYEATFLDIRNTKYSADPLVYSGKTCPDRTRFCGSAQRREMAAYLVDDKWVVRSPAASCSRGP